MRALILFELKKLFSKKANYVVIVLLLLLPIFELWFGMGTIHVNSQRLMFHGYYFDEGQELNGYDALASIDQHLHAFAGEITEEWEDDQLAQQMAEKTLLEQAREIDDQGMTWLYGEHWREFYEKSLVTDLTSGEIDDIRKAAGSATVGYSQSDTPEERAEPEKLYIAYTKESEAMVSSIYFRYPHVNSLYFTTPERYLASIEKEKAYKEYQDNRLLQIQKQEQPKEVVTNQFAQYAGGGRTDVINDYLNQKFLEKPTTYDSGIATEVFINIMNQKEMFIFVKFLLLGVLLVSVFNQEYSTKVDQVLKAMKVSSKKQAIAKFLCILLLCMSAMLYDLLVYFIGLQLLIGFHDLNVIFVNPHLVDTRIDTPIYTYREILFTCSLFYLLVGAWVASLISLISAFTKRSYSALVLYFVVISFFVGLPLLYQKLYNHEMQAAIFFPSALYRPDTLFTMRLINPFTSSDVILYTWNYLQLGNHVLPIRYLLFFLVPSVTYFLYYLSAHHYRSREIQNA